MASLDLILDCLNTAQKAAVTSPASILQVLAPPGSGKTKTLTSRVAYILAHHGYRPQDVICCTFTIKASREMRERLAKLVGNQVQSKLVLGTFHSICRRYLVVYGHLIGLRKGFGIADSGDSLAIIRVSTDLLIYVRARDVLLMSPSTENCEAATARNSSQHGESSNISPESPRRITG
ncbi:P-loop containing nucleoside triphosphate hydrolase protein [Aspergillus aurantiobrunneus]